MSNSGELQARRVVSEGTRIVPRDPERLIDKAAVNHYRSSEREAYAKCFNCAERQSVPYCWCDQVGRQIDLKFTCDRFKGEHGRD